MALIVQAIRQEFAGRATQYMSQEKRFICGRSRVFRELKAQVLQLAQEIDPSITIHDFRTTPGPLLTNLIFDMVVPYHFRMTDRETAAEIDRLVKERLGERYYTVATVERSYVWSGE